MKIVAFEGQGGARLGAVEGDQVVDLNAADSKLPADLGEFLAKNNGDTRPLADIAKRAKEYGKVLFDPRFVMPTSGRRLQKQGFLKMAGLYFVNFFSIVFRGKPATKGYTDVR